MGDLYASFMDEAAVEARGRQPLEADLADIRAVTDLAGLLSEMARLQLQGAVGGFLAPYVNTDAQDSSRYIVYLTQSGLGLPDESYYHQESFAAIREAYVAHIARMLLLAGWSADDARRAGGRRAHHGAGDRHRRPALERRRHPRRPEVLQPARAGRGPRVHRRATGSASGSRP